MNKIEEELWNYIDGHCNAVESAEIAQKIATDPQYQRCHQELLAINNTLSQLDFEEPSMGFTRNVMDKVALELQPIALKTKVDNRIVYGIGGFFICALLGLFGYAIAISDFDFALNMPKLQLNFDTSKLITPTFLHVFLLVDAVLGLLYLDSLLRKGKISAQKKGD